MSSAKALFILLFSASALLAAMAGFNYVTDPQCYYHCHTVDLKYRTLNSYYRMAQTIVAQPDAEVVILGSSRGQNTSPLWVQNLSGLKTINLSVSGADLTSKLAFLNLALEKTRVKKVIWLADYFEFIRENRDAKIANTPALRQYADFGVETKNLSTWFKDVQGLINHNTLEASLYFMNHQSETEITQGAGADIKTELCDSPGFQGKETVESLKSQVDMLYQNYMRSVLRPPQNEDDWKLFSKEMAVLKKKGIEVVIWIPPYHPEFIARLKIENPDLFARHQLWLKRLSDMADSNIKVLNYFEGVPDSQATPAFWNDGVHFTCKSSDLMLQETVKSWNVSSRK